MKDKIFNKKSILAFLFSLVLLLCGMLLLTTFKKEDNAKNSDAASVRVDIQATIYFEDGLLPGSYENHDWLSGTTTNYEGYPGFNLSYEIKVQVYDCGTFLGLADGWKDAYTCNVSNSLAYTTNYIGTKNGFAVRYGETVGRTINSIRFKFTYSCNSLYNARVQEFLDPLTRDGDWYVYSFDKKNSGSEQVDFQIHLGKVGGVGKATWYDRYNNVTLGPSTVAGVGYRSYFQPGGGGLFNPYNVAKGQASSHYHMSGWRGGNNVVYSLNSVCLYDLNCYYHPEYSEDTYKITWNLNGGEWDSDRKFDSTTYRYSSDSIKMPLPKRQGYHFEGWLSSADNTIKKANSSYSKLSSGDNTSITLTAQWKEMEITAYANGSTISSYNGWTKNNTTSCNKKGIDTYGNFPILNNRDGYYFNGWTYNGTHISSTDKVDYSKASYSIYADWQRESYNIKFYPNNPNNLSDNEKGRINGDSNYATITMTYGGSTSITATRKGYTLAGFADSSTGDVKYGFSNFLTKGTGDNYTFYADNDFGDDGVNVELYAIWKPITYTINFDINNVSTTGVSISPTGTPNPSSIPATYDTGTTLSVTGVSCVGYDLVGWGTERNGGTIYKNGNTLKNLSQTQGATVTLYAQWQAKEYTITFNTNGKTLLSGSGDITSQKKTYEQSLYMPKVSSLGYIFIGWLYNSKYFNADTTYTLKSITSGKEDNKSIEFVAQWQDTWANHVEQPTFVSGNYEVTKPAHLGWIAQQLQNGDTLSSYTFVQKGNIYLDEHPWLSEGTFSGTYNGNGYHIYNLKTTDNANVVKSNYEGLFAQTNNAVLTNISIMSGSLSGKSYVGALVGKASNTIIRNCINYASVTGTDNVGGLIGRKEESNKANASATISGCVNYGKVTSTSSYTGGLVGYISNSTINGCYVRASLTGGSNSGGIIGYGSSVTITGSAFVGSVNSASSYGIAGYISSGTVTDCLIDTGTIAIASSPFPSGATNCIAYGNGSNTTTSSMSYANWIQLNGKYFPKALTWAA